MKNNPLNKHGESSNPMTLRMNDDYANYLDNLKIETGLDKNQLIRLLIHLAPWNEEFQKICNHYYQLNPRSSKDRFIRFNEWRMEDVGWKRL